PAGGFGGLGQQAPPVDKPKPGATIKVTQPERTVVQVVFTITDSTANGFIIDRLMRPMVLHDKGYLDMASGQLRIHEVGKAVKDYAERNGNQLPRGTIDRPIPSNRAGRPYAPSQRLSWMVELLPYLGPEQEAMHQNIKRAK